MDDKLKIGNNIFCCNGAIVVGDRYYRMIYSFMLISVPSFICFYITLIGWDSNSKANLVIILLFMTFFYILAIIFLLMSGARDPGIFPRRIPFNFYPYYDDRKTVRLNIKPEF